jgi:transmembrane sensor
MSERPHPLQATLEGEPAGPRTVAAAWLARKRSGEMTDQEARELALWLEGDPANRAAYDLAQRVWGASASVRSNPTMLAMRERARRRYSWRSRAIAGGAVAATLVAAVFGGWVFTDTPSMPVGVPTPVAMSAPVGQEFKTEVGQRATVTLPDGSVVTLGTNTLLRTRESARQRLIELDRGQAFFRVAKDKSRPFIVRAAGRTVVATGTAFEVRVDQDRVAVTLVEGSVRVEAPINKLGDGRFSRFVQTTEMEPNSQLVAEDGKPWAVDEVDAEREVSWLTSKLVFQDEPLSRVVAELNRYSNKRIVIRDPSIAGLPVSGSFRTDDIDESVRALVAYGLADAAAERGGTIELSASTVTAAKKSS